MKICFVTTGDMKNNASSKRALGLAKYLVDIGWRVSILMEDTIENRHHVQMECSNDINVYFFSKMKGSKERMWKDNKIKEINPDVLYICVFVGRNIVGLRHESKRVVEHCELLSKCANIKWYRKIYYYICEFYSIFYADGFVNASRYLEKLYSKRVRRMLKSNMPMLYSSYAYHAHAFHVVKDENNNLYDNQLKSKTVFVYLGSIWREYGVFTIVNAAALLREKNEAFVIYILGGGKDFHELAQYVEKRNLQDYVHMTGYVEEEQIEKYFSLASAFISPMNDNVQDWARCPSKLFMYIPYQKPIITCKIGEPYEILGTYGMYYDSGSANSMSGQMLKIVQGRGAVPEFNIKKHTWEMRAKEFSEWFCEKLK